MIDMRKYSSILRSEGKSFGEIHRNDSKMVINHTFLNDPEYKKVKVLTKDGWVCYDAKYQYHSSVSIVKNPVDWYLQFRPDVHFPIGTYVLIPSDDDEDVRSYSEEFEYFKVENSSKRISNKTHLWFIVGRDVSNTFVRYNVLQCDWMFQWVYDGVIQNCIGCIRDAASYTSGIWRDEKSMSLDNLMNAWMPDLHSVYGNNLKRFGLCDNRTISHGTRFMLSNNTLNPFVYKVSKVIDMSPQGVIKLFLKQDDLNIHRDSVELFVCDYFTDNGNVIPKKPEFINSDVVQITSLSIREDETLGNPVPITLSKIKIGTENYFGISGWDDSKKTNWKIELEQGYSDEKHTNEYYENLVKISEVGGSAILVKAGKAKSLVGKLFKLCVYDLEGHIYATCKLEVSDGT